VGEEEDTIEARDVRTAALPSQVPPLLPGGFTDETYRSLRNFANTVRRDLKDLRPRDMIDLQSFIWVQGSDEY
jgi:hypothetical protein